MQGHAKQAIIKGHIFATISRSSLKNILFDVRSHFNITSCSLFNINF